MSQFVDQRDTHMNSVDTIEGIPFAPDSLLANLFGLETVSPVISQYIDVEDAPSDQDTYYAYSSQFADHTPVDSPLSGNASLVSTVNDDNNSFYSNPNDSFTKRPLDIHTSTTPLEARAVQRVSREGWDMLTPTELDQPPHLQTDGINPVPVYIIKQEHHHFAPQFPTPKTATGTQGRYISLQPGTSLHASYFPPQHEHHNNTQQQRQQQDTTSLVPQPHHQNKPRLPTPEENTVTIEESLKDQYIPLDSVRRLENYLQRVKDVHRDEGAETYHTDDNKTDSERSVTSNSPITTKTIRVRKRRAVRPALKRKSSANKMIKVEEKEKEETEKVPYVPIADSLRKNPGLWQKVQCLKKKGIYRCSHCPGVFNSLLDLAKHLDEFEVVRPYRCPFTDCPWYAIGLPRRAEVRRHCAAQHAHIIESGFEKDATNLGTPDLSSGKEAEKFQCSSPLCGKMFKRKDACQRHVKLVHVNPASRFNVRVNSLKDKYQTDDVEQLAGLLKTTNTHK